jgi:UDP-glucose 4-epimerase
VKIQDFGDVVVTGGAGAIGSRLVARLLEYGVGKIDVVDDLSSGYRWLLPDDSRVKVHVHDVADIGALSLSSRNPVVFHLAAFFANQNSVDHPQDDLHTNGVGTLSALMFAASVDARAFVYASAGCSIAGHGIDRPIREDMPVSLNLDTPYQITKALGEFYCNYFSSKVPSIRCRFFNSFGPGEVPGIYRNVIPNFIWKAMRNEDLVITGTGNETRDFIFVQDMVDRLISCAVTPGAYGEAINIGTGVETRIHALAELIIRETASKSQIKFAPRRSWDHSMRRQADVSKAESILGAKAYISVEDGVRETVRWFQDNYRDIAIASRGFV